MRMQRSPLIAAGPSHARRPDVTCITNMREPFWSAGARHCGRILPSLDGFAEDELAGSRDHNDIRPWPVSAQCGAAPGRQPARTGLVKLATPQPIWYCEIGTRDQ